MILVGLGNPGKEYAETRHNAGFMAVDKIAEAYGFSKWRSKFSSEIAEGEIGAEKILAIKPMTYMNNSGLPVQKILNFYKLPVEQMTVIHDELDLNLGKIRVKTGGGDGGHNGLKSLDAHVGKNYSRVRFGIGHPGHKTQVHNYVLTSFAREEEKTLAAMLAAIAESFPLLLSENAAAFMNKIVHLTAAIMPQTGQDRALNPLKIPQTALKPPANHPQTARTSPIKGEENGL